ncbi:MAG: PepSY-like domain-containing protein [Chitinophagales bacterium]
MKNIILAFLCPCIIVLHACGQKAAEVPDAVKTAFANKFPEAKKVSWDMEKPGEFEAEFKGSDGEYSANFTSDGTWVETEKEIDISDLPDAVQSVLNEQYGGYKSNEAGQVMRSDGSTFLKLSWRKSIQRMSYPFLPPVNCWVH